MLQLAAHYWVLYNLNFIRIEEIIGMNELWDVKMVTRNDNL